MGLGYLAAAARKRGIEVEVVDSKLEGYSSPQQAVQAIRSLHPTVVGLSAFTVEYPRAAEMAAELKKQDPGITVVLGGAHANAIPQEALRQAPGVDYVIAGEADTLLIDLVSALAAGQRLDCVAGLYYRGPDGDVCGSGSTWCDGDLSELPFPAWDLFPRVQAYPLLSERGCPYRCVFCAHNSLSRVHSRPIENVLEEIRWVYRDFGAREVYFEDETFGFHRERTEELLTRLIEFNRHAGMKFKAQTRVDVVTPALMRLMKRAVFDFIEMGVESGDPGVLERSRKGIRVEQVERAVRVAREAGIRPWVNFIIGLPGETRESVRNSIELAVKLNPSRLSIAIIVAYPGCEIYDWAVKGTHGYRLLSKEWDRFDKYLSSSVELETLDYRTMRRLQFRMYLETYLRNFRVVELSRLVWKNRGFFSSLGRRMLFPTSRQ